MMNIKMLLKIDRFLMVMASIMSHVPITFGKP
jgi:hypothetical protein